MARKIKYLLFVNLAAALCMMNVKGHAQSVDYKAYSLFVYNFMKYVEWPEDKPGNEFIIGILGESPITEQLQQLSGSKKVKGKNIIVKVFSEVDKIEECHLLYIPSKKSNLMKAVAEKIKTAPILVVAEREGMANKGAGISFVTMDDDILRFDINKNTLSKQNLKIQGALLSLGLVIQ